MIRITRETDYGVRLMAFMARDADQFYSAASLAEQNRLSLPMVSKILKTLSRAGLLDSQRGARGGYSLARAPGEISAAEIIGVLEGPIALTDCSPGAVSGCVHQDHCNVSNHWHRINRAVLQALDDISLLDLSLPPPVPVDMPSPIGARSANPGKPLTKFV